MVVRGRTRETDPVLLPKLIPQEVLYATREAADDVGIKRLKPTAQRQELWDLGCPGLVLRVTPRGTKTLSVIYRVRDQLTASGRMTFGSQKRITLGNELALAEARAKANEIINHGKAGRDPRLPASRGRLRMDNTFAQVRERFLKTVQLKSAKNFESSLRLHVEPRFGHRPIQDIRRADIHALLDELGGGGQGADRDRNPQAAVAAVLLGGGP